MYVSPAFLRVNTEKNNTFIVGDPAFVRDKSKELTVRVHDEC